MTPKERRRLAAERKKAERHAKREAGYKFLGLWVWPEAIEAIKAFAKAENERVGR